MTNIEKKLTKFFLNLLEGVREVDDALVHLNSLALYDPAGLFKAIINDDANLQPALAASGGIDWTTPLVTRKLDGTV